MRPVKLIAQIKLQTTLEHSRALLATLERMNEACDWISEKAYVTQESDAFELQKLYNTEVRAKFGITAQMAIRAFGKVAACYERDLTRSHRFRKRGAFPYDAYMLSFFDDDSLTIQTLSGRVKTTYIAGELQKCQLSGKRGQSDLIYRGGAWYMHVSIEAEPLEPIEAVGWLGVDLGIVNIATDSDGTIYSGAGVENVRVRRQRLRSELQACGTRSAKKHLKKDSKREANFRSNENHCISSKLVAHALETRRGIKLEDLSGIRDRTTVGREQRAAFGGWAFHQLRTYIKYKAILAGVPVGVVDPRNTSRMCPKCGHVAKANRKSQARFVCTSKSCDFVGHADVVGATNISRKAPVNEPIVSSNDRGKRDTRKRKNETSHSSGASPGL